MNIGGRYIRIGLLALFCGAFSEAVNNPLSVPLDGSIVRHNGEYFVMSAETKGLMLVSDNLLDWDESSMVLSSGIPGPYELLYRNGLFCLYAQEQGCFVSINPREPFSVIKKGAPPGLDMRLFQDPSGALFSVNRRVGDERDGEIWMQRYGAPWNPIGRPKQIFDGRLGMWDLLDREGLGDPEILSYRGNYYLLYAANNSSPRTGLREVGVAMNEDLVRFDNSDKLANPVLVRNVERLNRTYKTVLPSGEYAKWEGRYTFDSPGEGWAAPQFKMEDWHPGEGGFGFPMEDHDAQIHACRTKWDSGEIWVRRNFDLTAGVPETPVLNIRHEGVVEVYLNGQKVFESTEPSVAYSNFDLSESAAAFRSTDNVLAVHALAERNAGFQFLDFGLFDAEKNPVEPTVYGLTASRFVSGPNGFEKWLAYRAYWNGVSGTGFDRAFFFDDELVVDGPTTANTPGYHPPPARPTFIDTFRAAETHGWSDRWSFDGGGWASQNGAMHQSDLKGTAKAYLRQEPSVNYLFETNIRFLKDRKGEVGVVAFKDGQRNLIVSINPVARTWGYRIEPAGLITKHYKLPSAFKVLETPRKRDDGTVPLHLLRITKNGGHFEVMLDDFKLTTEAPIITKFTGAGVPGLYCRNASAEFDSVVYTVGWDEYDEYITGWGKAADGTHASEGWSRDKDDGLVRKRKAESGFAFKGDLLDQYEFTVNVCTEELDENKARLYGISPVFVDKRNYLKAMIDIKNRELVVFGKRNGKGITPLRKSLKRRIPNRHLYDKETFYLNNVAWVYRLRSKSIISALDIRWMDGTYKHLNQEFFVPVDDMSIKYAKTARESICWGDGRFFDADEAEPKMQKLGILNRITFREEVGNYVGFGLFRSVPFTSVFDSITKKFLRFLIPGTEFDPDIEVMGVSDDVMESDIQSRPQEALVTVEVESRYFFRCVKLKDKVIIELNGQPMLEVKGRWPASQVGLLSEGQPCSFNGITLMHLPAER